MRRKWESDAISTPVDIVVESLISFNESYLQNCYLPLRERIELCPAMKRDKTHSHPVTVVFVLPMVIFHDACCYRESACDRAAIITRRLVAD